MDSKFLQGIKLFNQKEYFACHEVLESLWKELPEDHNDRKFYQGIIQLSVALHLTSQKRYKGSEKIYKRAELNLANYNGLKNNVDLNSLLKDVKKQIVSHGQSENPIIRLTS